MENTAENCCSWIPLYSSLSLSHSLSLSRALSLSSCILTLVSVDRSPLSVRLRPLSPNFPVFVCVCLRLSPFTPFPFSLAYVCVWMCACVCAYVCVYACVCAYAEWVRCRALSLPLPLSLYRSPIHSLSIICGCTPTHLLASTHIHRHTHAHTDTQTLTHTRA